MPRRTQRKISEKRDNPVTLDTIRSAYSKLYYEQESQKQKELADLKEQLKIVEQKANKNACTDQHTQCKPQASDSAPSDKDNSNAAITTFSRTPPKEDKLFALSTNYVEKLKKEYEEEDTSTIRQEKIIRELCTAFRDRNNNLLSENLKAPTTNDPYSIFVTANINKDLIFKHTTIEEFLTDDIKNPLKLAHEFCDGVHREKIRDKHSAWKQCFNFSDFQHIWMKDKNTEEKHAWNDGNTEWECNSWKDACNAWNDFLHCDKKLSEGIIPIIIEYTGDLKSDPGYTDCHSNIEEDKIGNHLYSFPSNKMQSEYLKALDASDDIGVYELTRNYCNAPHFPVKISGTLPQPASDTPEENS